ncbi:LolA family protein [Candidatus Magnetaquicoccus inordinatus]|uniref:LolA family protein n=1 Tax=Candidatus Magnetaquicoccus inordinatus TaxID=2496818 RepID=UPI00102B0679|nr:hypothetical protein [Candidatus Magnetaquicoccus inordinatus]
MMRLCFLILLTFNLIFPDCSLAAPMIKEGESLRCRFTMNRHLQGFNKPLHSEGSLLLIPGKGLLWKTEQPFSSIVAISSSGINHYANNDKILSIASQQIPFLHTLRQLFEQALTGNEEGLSQFFHIHQENQRIELRKRPDIGISWPLQKIIVQREGQNWVESVEIVKENGDRDIIHFLEQRLTQNAPTAEEIALLAGADP